MEEQHKSVHMGGMCYSQGPLSGRGKMFKVVQWYCVVEQYRMVVLVYWKKKAKAIEGQGKDSIFETKREVTESSEQG